MWNLNLAISQGGEATHNLFRSIVKDFLVRIKNIVTTQEFFDTNCRTPCAQK